MKIRLKKHKINESVAGITDPTLMQQAINIENQKIQAKAQLDNAQRQYEQKIQNLDKQMLQLLEKQKTLNNNSGNSEESTSNNSNNKTNGEE